MKKIFLVSLIIIVFFPGIFSQADNKNKKNAKNAYNSAVEYIGSLNFEAALPYLDAAVELDPALNEALIQRGKLFIELGRVKDAIADFNKACVNEPNNGEPDFYLAYLAFPEDTSSAVIARFTTAINKGFIQPEAYYYLGLCQYLRGNYPEALKSFTSAIEKKDNYFLAYHDRASVKRSLGDFQGAQYDYRMALNYNSNSPLAYNNMGSVKVAIGDYQGALEDYSVAIKLDPDFFMAYNNRGIARYFLGQTDSAIVDFDIAASLHPDYIPALNNKASGLSRINEYKESIALFDKIIQFDNSFGKAYLNRGLVRELTGDLSGACDDWRKALELGISQAEQYIKECK